MAKSSTSTLALGGFVWSRFCKAMKGRGGRKKAFHIPDKEGSAPLIDVTTGILFSPVTVDYGQSFEDMVKVGKYDYIEGHITAANFPIHGGGTVNFEIVLFHPNRDIKSEDVVTEMEHTGLRPSTLPELCAYGVRYPDTQLGFSIVALGSSWVGPSGLRLVPCLLGLDGRRYLNLYDWSDEWRASYRFAAVRK